MLTDSLISFKYPIDSYALYRDSSRLTESAVYPAIGSYPEEYAPPNIRFENRFLARICMSYPFCPEVRLAEHAISINIGDAS